MTISFSPLEYLGTIADGVFVLLSVVYENEYHEATLFYTREKMLLTLSEDLEEKLGGPLEKNSEYQKILVDLHTKVVPYDQIYNRLDPVDVTRWTKQIN